MLTSGTGGLNEHTGLSGVHRTKVGSRRDPPPRSGEEIQSGPLKRARTAPQLIKVTMTIGESGTSLSGGSAGGLAGPAASGVVWSVGQKWVIRVTGFITIAVLTRILTPADFGVVAVAVLILPLLQLVADLGFTTYILQDKEVTRRALSTVFWYSAGAGLLLTAGLIVCAPLVGWLLRLPNRSMSYEAWLLLLCW